MEDNCNNSDDMLFSGDCGIVYVLAELFWVSECFKSVTALFQ